MKLFVDDIRNSPDDSWHVARTALEAIRAIHRYNFEVISLDHDISHQVHMDDLSRPYPCAETFASVAYYIVAKYSAELGMKDGTTMVTTVTWCDLPKVILHTSNQVAGDEMFDLLSKNKIPVEKKYTGAVNRLEMEI